MDEVGGGELGSLLGGGELGPEGLLGGGELGPEGLLGGGELGLLGGGAGSQVVMVVMPCGPLVVVTIMRRVVVGAAVVVDVTGVGLPTGEFTSVVGVDEVPTVWPVYGFTCTRWFGDWLLVVLGAALSVATVPSAVASTTPETASMIGTRAERLSGGGAVCSRGLSSSIASPQWAH